MSWPGLRSLLPKIPKCQEHKASEECFIRDLPAQFRRFEPTNAHTLGRPWSIRTTFNYTSIDDIMLRINTQSYFATRCIFGLLDRAGRNNVTMTRGLTRRRAKSRGHVPPTNPVSILLSNVAFQIIRLRLFSFFLNS